MQRFDLYVAVLGCTCVVMLAAGRTFAQPDPSAEEDVVVATVDVEPIYARDVDRLLAKVTREQEVNPATLPMLRAQVLAEIVDRRLVLAYARRVKSGAREAEVDAALAAIKAKLAAQERSLADFLKERSLAEADLRRQITWELTWKKYLARYVTDERLAAHFNAHRHQFDGTQLSVSHILLQPAADAGPEAVDELIRRAQAIRGEITSGKMSFAEAARKHSAGPSARKGGQLGFIARRGAMVESFARAAFALEPGQVSKPVTTPFGVHLIRCNEIKPGSKQQSEVRGQLEEALARELLDKLARLQRQYTPAKFTGKAPYFKPGTRELVVP